MDRMKAVIFDLDNTILNRTRTFEGFTQSLINTYFGHMESTEHIKQRIRLDEDGYKEKPRLFNELLAELPWAEHPSTRRINGILRQGYVRNAVLMDEAREWYSI